MLITPIKKICTPVIVKKNLKKGLKVNIRYYCDFKEHLSESLFDPSDKQVSELYKKYELKSYNFGEEIYIELNEINDFITKNFRYCQPKKEYEYQEVPIPPYILGVWLGDGHTDKPSLTNIDKVIIEEWCKYAENENCRIRQDGMKERKTTIMEYENDTTSSYHIRGTKQRVNPVLNKFKNLNLIGNKHIPEIYLKNSFEIRSQLLAGLIDTDGSLGKSSYEISQKSIKLSEDIVELAKSLGFYTQISQSIKKCTNSKSNPNHSGTYNRMYLSINLSTVNIPVRCDRKKFNRDRLTHINNPLIDLQGNIITAKDKTPIQWDDELTIQLLSTIKRFKELEPNQRIPWVDLHKYNTNLPPNKSEPFRAKYKQYDELLKQYDGRLIELNFIVIDDDWMRNYNKIKNLWSNNLHNGHKERLIADYLDNWLRSQLEYIRSSNVYLSKKKLIEELLELQPKSYASQLMKTLEYIKNQIILNGDFENVILLKNGKLYIPSVTKYDGVGPTISRLLSVLSKTSDCNYCFDNISDKDKLIKKYEDILDEYHLNKAPCRKDTVIQMDDDKNIISEYTCCINAAKELIKLNKITSFECGRRNISKACKSKNKCYGYYWITWLDFYKDNSRD
jgi:hypothetical protein